VALPREVTYGVGLVAAGVVAFVTLQYARDRERDERRRAAILAKMNRIVEQSDQLFLTKMDELAQKGPDPEGSRLLARAFSELWKKGYSPQIWGDVSAVTSEGTVVVGDIRTGASPDDVAVPGLACVVYRGKFNGGQASFVARATVARSSGKRVELLVTDLRAGFTPQAGDRVTSGATPDE
jgi:hypothetical protein